MINDNIAQALFANSAFRFASIDPARGTIRVDAKDFTEAEKEFTKAVFNGENDCYYRFVEGDRSRESVLFNAGREALFYYLAGRDYSNCPGT